MEPETMLTLAVDMVEVSMEMLAANLRTTAALAASERVRDLLLTTARLVEGVDRGRAKNEETYLRAAKWALEQVDIELGDLDLEPKGGRKGWKRTRGDGKGIG